MTPGIHDISIEEYHSSEGISRSGLMAFRKSPYHYHWEYILGNRREKSSDALLLGNAFHTAILEPKEFNSRFCVLPKFDRRTKIGKEMYEQARLTSSTLGQQLINQDDYETLKAMRNALTKNMLGSGLITNSKYEKSIYWTDEDTGLLCKCRPDILQNNYIADLKTTRDASFNGFQKELYSYGYYIQAAMIYEGLKAVTNTEYKNFVFIAIEKEAPYAVCCYQLDELALLQGIADFKQSLAEIKQCMENDIWPAYENQVMGLPKWV